MMTDPVRFIEDTLGIEPLTWTTQDNRVLFIRDMSTSYLRNTRMHIRERVKMYNDRRAIIWCKPKRVEDTNLGEVYTEMGRQLELRGFNLSELENDTKQPITEYDGVNIGGVNAT